MVAKKLFVLLISLLLLVIVFSGCFENKSSEHKTWYVGDGKDSDFALIQDAINGASPGDTIFVYEGVYDEVLLINVPVNLVGADVDNTYIYPSVVKENAAIVSFTVDDCSIEGFTITCDVDDSKAIGIKVGASDNRIYGNSLSKVEYGVYLFNDLEGYIISGNNISSNTVSNCTYGIYVYSDAKNNVIFNNDVLDNREGMYLYYFVNNSVLDNYVFSNTVYGIYIGLHSDGNVVSGNVIIDNRYGIRFKGVSNNEIFMNRLVGNELGLYSCCGSEGNYLYYNSLIDNEDQATDSFTNFWYKNGVGNYWSNYLEIYPNATVVDGVWGIPYNISGGSNKDYFPLVSPYI